MTDDIGYQALTQAAMRGVMKEALKIAASDAGLPGSHHFYITFRTNAPGVKIADHLRQRFPEEMVIVIQHQFWELEVEERHFEVVLQFSGVPQHLEVPYSAVTRFYDPSVEFGMGFEPMAVQHADTIEPITTKAPPAIDETPKAEEKPEASEEESRPASDGTVVRLDTFRRK